METSVNTNKSYYTIPRFQYHFKASQKIWDVTKALLDPSLHSKYKVIRAAQRVACLAAAAFLALTAFFTAVSLEVPLNGTKAILNGAIGTMNWIRNKRRREPLPQAEFEKKPEPAKLEEPNFSASTEQTEEPKKTVSDKQEEPKTTAPKPARYFSRGAAVLLLRAKSLQQANKDASSNNKDVPTCESQNSTTVLASPIKFGPLQKNSFTRIRTADLSSFEWFKKLDALSQLHLRP